MSSCKVGGVIVTTLIFSSLCLGKRFVISNNVLGGHDGQNSLSSFQDSNTEVRSANREYLKL